jgi:hypothetical protein
LVGEKKHNSSTLKNANQIGKSDKNAIEDKIIGYYTNGKLSDVHHQLL